MAELVDLDGQVASRRLRQVCALPAVCACPHHTRVFTCASAHPSQAGRLWWYIFDGGSIQPVVITYGPGFVVVGCAVHMEHVGRCHASLLVLRGYARMVLAATVWPPQLLSMSSMTVAVTRLSCLRDPPDRTE